MKRSKLNGSPDFTNRIKASFLLPVRSYNTVRTIRSVRIQNASFVCTHDCFINKCPYKTTRKHRIRFIVIPVIFQACTSSLIILGMQELSRHKHIISISEAGRTCLIRRIMMGIQSVKVCPWMNNMTLLRIIIGKTSIQCLIPATLITITPHKNTRMIYVIRQHLPKQILTCFIVIPSMPSGKLCKIKYSERITHIQEMFIGWIVRTYSIHIHFFYQQSILHTDLPVRSPTTLRMETMTIHTFHQHFCAIYINAIFRTELNCTETYTFLMNMRNLLLRIKQFQS
ncbi:unknown [Bacteroides intestinalis CAG:315]|nr:unknown [Bacteroides intestinalis CAG:315]